MFRLDKRCLSAIVALILFLTLTVGGYIILQDWFTEFSSDFQSDYRSQNPNPMYRTDIQGLEGENLYFKNTFGENISIFDVKVGNVSCGITGNLGVGFQSINLSTCYENVSCGVNEFVLVTNRGVFTKTYYLGTSILGAPLGEYGCSNPFICFINPTPVDNLITTNRDHLINVSIALENIENISFNWNGVSQDIGTQDTFVKVIDWDVGGDGARSVYQTLDGGFVVTGQSISYPNNGLTTLYLVKYDEDGNQDFFSYLDDGTYHTYGYQVIQLSDSSYIVEGRLGVGAGDADSTLSKFDSDGNELWTNYFGGSGYDLCFNVLPISDGFIVSGSSTSFGAGSSDGVIFKFDSNGNKLWHNYLGGINEDSISGGVVETSDGDFIGTGHTQNYGDGPEDLMIYKFNFLGILIWSKYLANGASYFANGFKIINSSDGNYVVIGRDNSFGNGDTDWVIFKINETGDRIWGVGLELIGGNDEPWNVIETSDGNYVVVGQTYSIGQGQDDILISKFNSSNGEEIWSTLIGGVGYDEAYGLVELNNESLIITGQTTSFGGSDWDAIIIKTDKNGVVKNFENYSRPNLNSTIINYDFITTSVSTSSFAPNPAHGLQIKSSTLSTSVEEIFEVENNLELKGTYPNQYFEVEKSLGIGTSVYSAEVCDISSCYQTETRSITTNREDFISNSLLFDGVDDYLSWTPTLEGNRTTWTFSTWVKKAYSSDTDFLFSARIDGWNCQDLYFASDNKLYWEDYDQGVVEPAWRLYPSNYFRDYSEWMNVILVVETNNATDSQRNKIYIDGKKITDFDTEIYPSLNYITQIGVNSLNQHYIAATSSGNYLSGYMSEINFIDGQALDASYFGEFNQYGKWVPKKYSGTYGTNGFYLTFENSSNLGQDFSGNGNNWTINGDPIQTIDTPENNFAVLNILAKGPEVSCSESNYCSFGGGDDNIQSSLGFNSGKYYAEVTLDSTDLQYLKMGICEEGFKYDALGSQADGYTTYVQSNAIIHPYIGMDTSGYGLFSGGDIIGIAANLDDKTVQFYQNGVIYGPLIDISGYYNDSAIFCLGTTSGITGRASAGKFNFGATPFQYAPPAGYKTLSSKNLPAPTVIPSQGFDVLTYTGTGANRDIEGLDFSPSLVWIKNRDQADSHKLFDIVRGPTKYRETDSYDIQEVDANSLTSFNLNGFSLGTGANGFNDLNEKFVAWNWKEGPEFGFDIVNYIGNGIAGRKIGHNLNKIPELMLFFNLDLGQHPTVYHKDIGPTAGLYTSQNVVPQITSVFFNDEYPNDINFTVGANAQVNDNSYNYTAYLFTSIPGFSKVGSYTGNGDIDGPFIYTGFKPKFIMYKSIDVARNWDMYDTARNPSNPINMVINPNLNVGESSHLEFDILSNGYKIRNNNGGSNAAGENYIYVAFADYPMSTNY